ncbi:MAG TPA: rhomboid family intramembrane serine protease [Actinomycetota bacterium]|nr:rhomboid family intramembrane serine protease [Actinomycetota bacterium]
MSSIVPPPPPVIEHCYRHPDVETGVHCTRCGRPICTDCMLPAAVGHQCPECVKEAKQEFVRPARSRVTSPARGLTVTNVLLLIMVAVFALEVALGGTGSLLTGPDGSILIRMGANVGLAQPANGGCLIGIAAGQYWRLVTPIFLHAGVIHIAFNGYALYIVGNVVEQELGWRRFLAIFFVTGIFASAASYTFGSYAVPGVGASGAIYGLFGAFFAYNWRWRSSPVAAMRMRSMATLIAINLVLSFSIKFIDWHAHVGGLIAGIVMGLAAEGVRNRTVRMVAFPVAAIALLLVGAALVTAHTQTLRTLAGPLLKNC